MGEGFPNAPTDYEFVQVGGEGAHEIPVGPIHAGLIEPGHFRFSVVGERVLRLEQRLGYQHKGVEKLFIGADIARGAKLAGRVSGDSTCAYAWAYAGAVEAACGVEAPPRALAVRALLLERERIANHLGDLGALGNDAAFAFGLTQFFRLKEDWVRLNAQLFGHRFLMDCIVPGGVTVDPDAAALAAIVGQCDTIERAVKELRELYDEHPGLQDRFATTGIIDSNLARELSLTGMAARATGILLDGRAHRQGYTPPPPYAALGVRPVTDERGDVAARVAVRFDEIAESLRLLRLLAVGMAAGDARVEVSPVAGGCGLGVIEGWRGEVLVGVQFDGDGKLARVHPHDPSWQVWPALEHAVMNDIVPDFPLINKSFNLSYSGVDL
jgi:Ni,Fe-hydrogenase III large subunit